MIKFFIRKFIHDFENVHDAEVRKKYGILSGVIGIICNILLFILKFVVGLIMNSIAVISDAFNNLMDSGSSIITIFGANLSNKPPDKEHPYGHGRVEYIASFIVSFIIFIVGFELLKGSIGKIIKPEVVKIQVVSLVILGATVFIKLWMYSYNKFIGEKINSSMNRAVAKDSLNDVVSSIGVIIGTIIGAYINFPVDGILGLMISILIIYTGFITAKESVHFLLGPSPDPEILTEIERIVSDSDMVQSVHDLRIHDYGPGRKLASLHAVVPPHVNVEEAHYEIHRMEQIIKNN